MVGPVRAFLFRGGTSKGLFLRAADLPPRLRALVPAPGGVPACGDHTTLESFIAAAMGSDRYGMQLNGVGGGISSTSKVAIVEQSSRPGYDVDYTFGQVDMKSGRVDWSGSCGNLASAVALFALQEGLVVRSRAGADLVKIFQANLKHSIHVSVPHADAAQDQTIPGIKDRGSNGE